MTAFVRNRYPLPSENVIANSCVFSHSTGHPYGMVYRRFKHGTVNTPCDEYGTVLASYYATTVCYRILLRHSCENGPPSITVCVAGWSCVGTPTIECPRGGDVRKCASAEERTAKKQKTTTRHFGFTEKVSIRISVHGLHIQLSWKR